MLGLCKCKEGGRKVSAYSEWKFGLITDAEYAAACREEEVTTRYWEEHPEEFNDEEVFEDDDIEEF